jgi:hypothetical protein
MWDNAPQAHSRVSNINYDIWKKIVEGSLKISHEKYIKDGNFLAHFGLNLKVLPRFLTDLSA